MYNLRKRVEKVEIQALSTIKAPKRAPIQKKVPQHLQILRRKMQHSIVTGLLSKGGCQKTIKFSLDDPKAISFLKKYLKKRFLMIGNSKWFQNLNLGKLEKYFFISVSLICFDIWSRLYHMRTRPYRRCVCDI